MEITANSVHFLDKPVVIVIIYRNKSAWGKTSVLFKIITRRKNSWKRAAAGVMALAIVASNVTANVEWVGLLGNSTITASAADEYVALPASTTAGDSSSNVAGTVTVESGSYGSLTHTATANKGYIFDHWEFTISGTGIPSIDGFHTSTNNPITNSNLQSIAAYFKELPAPEIQISPMAADNLTYDSNAKNLLKTASTASEGSTMQYAVVPDGKKPATKIVEGDNISSEPEVGAVYKPTGLYGIYFPNHHIKYNDNEYYISEDLGRVYYNTSTGKTIIAGLSSIGSASPVNLPDDCDAIYVESISDNVMTVRAVNTADYVQAAYSTSATATNAGKYDVYYKAVRSDGVESEADHIDVTIDKGNPVITYPSPANPGYNGQLQNLITAGTFAQGTTIKYGVSDTQLDLNSIFADGIVEQTDNISLTVDNPQAGYIYKPQDISDIYFKGYDLYINDTNYSKASYFSVENSTQLYVNVGKLKVGCNTGAHTISENCDAIYVTKVENNTIYAEPVNSSNYTVFKMTTEIPQKTNVGTYYVYYKVEGNDNYNSVDPTPVQATKKKKKKKKGETLDNGVD